MGVFSQDKTYLGKQGIIPTIYEKLVSEETDLRTTLIKYIGENPHFDVNGAADYVASRLEVRVSTCRRKLSDIVNVLSVVGLVKPSNTMFKHFFDHQRLHIRRRRLWLTKQRMSALERRKRIGDPKDSVYYKNIMMALANRSR